MKDLFWVGSSKKDLVVFPKEVIQEMGSALCFAQLGGMHDKAKPFKGCGPGVFEIAIEYRKNAFRSLYAVNIGSAVYVIHCFQKKSKTGIKTPRQEVEKIKNRVKQLRLELRQVQKVINRELENV